MTPYEPWMRVDRLIVLKANRRAYDQEFTGGLNVISGENSSGKTTLVNLLFFALGGDFFNWTPEARSCDFTIIQVSFSRDTVLTLKRPIESQSRRSLEIYWGALEDALGAGPESWERYPYQGSAAKESFSQLIFRVAKFPEVHGEAASKITMHQLLRLIFADQTTPPSRLFRLDAYDSGLIRQTVSDLLLGVYDDRLYNQKLLYDEKAKEYEKIEGKLRNIYQILGRTSQDLSSDALDQEVLSLRAERETLIEKLESQSVSDETTDAAVSPTEEPKGEVLAGEIRKLKKNVDATQNEISQLEYEAADSANFIKELERRLLGIKQSEAMALELGEVEFEYCPSCLKPISREPEEGHCALCKEQLDTPSGGQLAKMRNELEVQIRESKELVEDRHARIRAAREELRSQREKLALKQDEYRALRATATTDEDEWKQALYKRIGYIDAEIENIGKRRELIATIDDSQKKKASLAEELETIGSEIAGLRKRQERRREETLHMVSEKTVFFLRHDLNRQEVFKNARSVELDFDGNGITVDGEGYFSESSTVFLNKSVHMGLLMASIALEYMRFPRFLLLDGVEDGGMEVERAHNFQSLVADASANAGDEHQIIMTTSEINPDLYNAGLVVGEHYTHDRRTLRI